MKMLKILGALPMVLIASQAQAAENWVKIATDAAGHAYAIDANSIRKSIDGLVYFTGSSDGGNSYLSEAVDCQRGVLYLIGGSDGDVTGWRGKGSSVRSGSIGEVELKAVCEKAGSSPLPGHWVAIGFGQSIDKDSIRRGSDGLVHFTSFDDTYHLQEPDAADCRQRLIYFGESPGWRDRGRPVGPKTFAEAELDYACANAQ